MGDLTSAGGVSQSARGSAPRQAAFGFIFASALMNSISFGIMLPIVPNLIRELAGGDTSSASEWNVLFATSWGVMQLFCGPLLGMLSDRIGRRPVLLISFFGLGLDFLLMAYAPNLWWLLAGRLLNGATASTMSTANAYLADVTPPDQRAKTFGLMASAFSIGFIVGPMIGGLLGEYGLRLPFIAVAVITFANAIYGLLVLPESLPKERRAKRFEWGRANPLGALRLLRSHSDLLPLAGVAFLFQLSQMVLPTIYVLYTAHRYGWSTGMEGAAFLLIGVLGVFVQMVLVGPVVARIGLRNAILLGAVSGAACYAWYGAMANGWVFLVGAALQALQGFLMPGLQGLMTRLVRPEEQGQLQGANQSMMGVASIAGPMIFGMVFAWSVRHETISSIPGLAFYVASGLMVAAVLLAFWKAQPPEKEA